ncbi:response regulator transcription factor [candidate division WOR-3 bacterium]|nr:response regulator transcription factor [candidate division WOR-3 bacterium]
MKVFIVDDSKLVRERLITMLSELVEIEIVGQAQDVLEAEKSIQELCPNVVVLDIRLPKGNGIGVLKNIKKYKPAPIVIMLTNYPYPQYRKKCLTAGADFFFEKSTEFEKVTEVLKQMIQDSNIHKCVS